MSTARDLVTKRTARQAKRYPDLELSTLDAGPLSPQDAALAAAIDHAVARRWLTLTAIVESRLTRPWENLEARMQAALLVGAAQLLLLDRLPDHAVINESVQWAKDNVRPKAGGLVNAVLRKIAGLRKERLEAGIAGPPLLPADVLPLADGRAWQLAEPAFADDPIVRIAQQTSHPIALVRHWHSVFGPDVASQLTMHSLVHAPIIIGPVDESELSAGSGLTPHAEAGFAIHTGQGDGLVDLLGRLPGARVQDPGAAAAGAATGALRPACIIDYCAGRGTKTHQLAATHRNARVIATDVESNRLAKLRQTFGGHDRVHIVGPDEIRRFTGEADLLVLDVPCSNTGVLARRVEAKYRCTRQSIENLVALQRQIVADALPLMADAGCLLYSTCSIDPAENERQAEWIARWHRMKITAARSRMPSGLPGDDPAGYSDGGFFAMLRRQ